MSIEIKRNISILRVVNTFYPKIGGSVTHVVELTARMNPFFANQLIISPQYSNDCRYFDDNFIVPIVRVNSEITENQIIRKLPGFDLINHLFYSYNASCEIKKMILNGKCIDLIYVHNLISGLFLCFFSKIFRLNTPIIIMHHHGHPLYSGKIKLRGSIYNLFILSMIYLFRPDHYIQLYDGILDKRFLHFLSKIGIHFTIVNHAIDMNIYSCSNKKSDIENFIILSTHRLDSFKRIDLTIKSFKLFLDKIQSSKHKKKPCLKIVGSGPLLIELKRLVNDLEIMDSVIFVGEKSQEEIINEIISSDIIVGTSLVSNMNRSILEAMSCGKPVLIFGNSVEGDLFINMENSILVDFGDIVQFADRLKLLFENGDLRDRIGKNAEISIKSERNWETRIIQELNVCSDIFSKDIGYGPQS